MNAVHNLQDQVQDALMDAQDMQDYRIEVFNSNGVITLRGEVPSREERDRAEAIVRGVEGVTGVINELDVV